MFKLSSYFNRAENDCHAQLYFLSDPDLKWNMSQARASGSRVWGFLFSLYESMHPYHPESILTTKRRVTNHAFYFQSSLSFSSKPSTNWQPVTRQCLSGGPMTDPLGLRMMMPAATFMLDFNKNIWCADSSTTTENLHWHAPLFSWSPANVGVLVHHPFLFSCKRRHLYRTVSVMLPSQVSHDGCHEKVPLKLPPMHASIAR